MRTHRTIGATIAVSLAAAVALTACSNGGDSGDGPVTITFWNSFTAADRPFVEQIVQNFNDSQDDVYVDMDIQPNDVLQQKLLPAYVAGEGPTIASLDASLFPSYAEAGVLAPVDDFYSSGLLDPSILPQASLDATTWDGQVYGVPMIATASMLYWNTDLFEAAGLDGPPTTMDELVADAKAITQYTAGQDTSNTYGLAIPETQAIPSWAVLVWSEGGDFVNADGTESLLGTDDTIAAFDFWNDLIQNDHISPVGLTGVDGDSLFSAGRAGMLMNGPWASAGFTDAGVNFDVAPVPAGPAGQFANAVSVNMHLNADATDAERDAAYQFFAFWNSVDSQKIYALGAGFPPTRSDIPASELSDNPVSAKFSEATGGRFYLQGLSTFSDIDNNVVIPTIQKITTGQGTPDELLPDASAQIDAILAG
ncbi:MAG: ABC transporter substrate-binding protein [Actinomycetales bacterium]|nr:ABC transporter substrate-binding protein [Actinomycetales bacterium]